MAALPGPNNELRNNQVPARLPPLGVRASLCASPGFNEQTGYELRVSKCRPLPERGLQQIQPEIMQDPRPGRGSFKMYELVQSFSDAFVQVSCITRHTRLDCRLYFMPITVGDGFFLKHGPGHRLRLQRLDPGMEFLSQVEQLQSAVLTQGLWRLHFVSLGLLWLDIRIYATPGLGIYADGPDGGQVLRDVRLETLRGLRELLIGSRVVWPRIENEQGSREIVRHEDLPETTRVYAFKAMENENPIVVKVRKSPETGMQDADGILRQITGFMTECRTHMRASQNQYALTFLGYDSRTMAMFLEHMDGGAMADRKDDKSGCTLAPTEILLIWRDIANILKFFEKSDFVHCNINPSNIHLRGEGDQIVAKLSDFDLSPDPDENNLPRSSAEYLPPEFVSHLSHGKPGDVWALGPTVLWGFGLIGFPKDIAVPWSMHALLNANFDAARIAQNRHLTVLEHIRIAREIPLRPALAAATAAAFPGREYYLVLLASMLVADHTTRVTATEVVGRLRLLALYGDDDPRRLQAIAAQGE